MERVVLREFGVLKVVETGMPERVREAGGHIYAGAESDGGNLGNVVGKDGDKGGNGHCIAGPDGRPLYDIPVIARQRVLDACGVVLAEELLCRETGVVMDVRWDLRLIRAAHLLKGKYPIHINVIPQTFRILNLLNGEMQMDRLKEWTIFEILEFDIEAHIPDIVEFAENGFMLALDDFGKGESNYHLLSEFPSSLVPIIKLDMLFQEKVFDGEKFLAEKIAMLRRKGYRIYIEGVEDFAAAKALGADGYQGYAVHMPAMDKRCVKCNLPMLPACRCSIPEVP